MHYIIKNSGMKLLAQIFFTGVLQFLIMQVSAQSLIWADVFGSGNGITGLYFTDIATSSEGIIYSVGNFVGEIDFSLGPLTTTFESSDRTTFLSAHDAAGNFLWNIHFVVDEGQNQAQQISVDSEDNIVITGSITGSFDADMGNETLMLSNSEGVYASKFTSQGQLLWARTFEYSEEDNGYSSVGHAIDAEGNIYVALNIYEGIDLLEGENELLIEPENGNGFAIVKLSPAGEVMETTVVSGADALSISVSETGVLTVAGSFDQIVDFDPSDGSFEMDGADGNIFIIQFSADGQFQWARQIGNAWPSSSYNNLHSSTDGSVYLGTSTIQTMEVFGQTYGGIGGRALLIKFLPDGGDGWVVEVGGESVDYIDQIIENDNGLVITGKISEFAEVVTSDENYSITSGALNNNEWDPWSDVCVMSLTNEGEFNWGIMWGALSGDSQPVGIDFLNGNSIVCGGSYFEPSLFDLDFTDETMVMNQTSGSHSISVIDLNTVSVLETETAELEIFPNPSFGFVQISNAGEVKFDAVQISTLAGHVVDQLPLNSQLGNVGFYLPEASGMYLIQMLDDGAVIQSSRILKY